MSRKSIRRIRPVGPSSRIGGESSIEKTKKFELKSESAPDGDSKFSWKINGRLNLGIKGTVKVLYEPYWFSAKLGELGMSPVPGLYIGIRPELKATADASLELTATLKFTVEARTIR
ncbi:MAG: hypothetical protein HFE86_05625 [Clostridiales bacterium]|nr:hypothetical protein [Clostridiales bacterium]